MGSLPSLPPPPLSPENPANSFRIFASFCPRSGCPATSAAATAAMASNWLESYTPTDNLWRRVSPIPGIPENHFLKGFSMVPLGNFIYIVGGRLCCRNSDSGDVPRLCCRNSDSGVSDEIDLAVRGDVLRYEVSTGEWSSCSPLLVPRFDFACAAVDGKIYVAGGQCVVLPRGRGTKAAEVYDPVADRWQPLPGMSALRYKCVGVAWRGRFHVVGGFAVESDHTVVPFMVERSSAEMYDAGRGEWEVMPGMWQLDVPPNQIVAIEGRLFSSGDCLNTWKGHIESYDGKVNIWNIVEGSHLQDLYPAMTRINRQSSKEDEDDGVSDVMLERLYLTMAPIGTRLYFLAGYRMPGDVLRSVSVVLTFDTAATTTANAWRSSELVEEDGDKELCAHCCVVQL